MRKLNKYIVFLTLSLLAITMLIGCSIRKESQDIFNLEQFQSEMKAQNYNFELQDAEKDFLKAPRKRMIIGEESLDIYSYGSNKEMEADAKNINMDGWGYSDGNNSMSIDWISIPHFYKKGNIIILYVGENEQIISDLKNTLGEPFAGNDKDY